MNDIYKDNTPLIEISDATVYRGDVKVFDHLDLEISQNESTVVLGPNGSGKTTLLKIIARELYPIWHQNLVVRILGMEKVNLWNLRSCLGLISNDLQYNYSPEVLGSDVVLSGFFSSVGVWRHHEYNTDHNYRVNEIMNDLSVAHLASTPFGKLSTGQQRMLLLCRALVNNPPNLLFDEPTNGLDLYSTFTYLECIRGLIKSKHNIVLVTHNIHEIPPEVSKVILLNKGKVWMQGSKKEVLTKKNLSELYEVNLSLVESGGWYQVIPA